MTTLVASEALAIPASHLDLLVGPICGVLTTMGGDGQPQSSLVWVDFDSACARVNTTLERQKGRNLLANPKVVLRAYLDEHGLVDDDDHRWWSPRPPSSSSRPATGEPSLAATTRPRS